MDNFIVSARKYRPATFESVVGQGHITATLKNAISRGQLAHAYLFCGPRGVGKTTCARIFAKAINCLSPVDSEACGECESCRSFNEGRSFNIHELDAASNNSVDDIRSLTEQVRIPPQIGRYSVYIIDEVHMLSASAFNAFLKTLEEPPAHAVFILATTEKHKIIPTILSRCQIYDFNRIRVEDGVRYLKYIAGKEGVTFDDESLHLIAQKADGGMRDALSMFDKAVSFCGSDLRFKEVARTLNVLDYDTYFNITSLILSGDYPSTLTAFDLVLRNGFTPQTFVGGLNAHFRDLLMSKSPQTAGLLEVTGELLERYKKQGADCDVGFLFEAIAVLTSVDGTLKTATNQRLNVELGLMKLCGLGQKKNRQAVEAGSVPGEVAHKPNGEQTSPASVFAASIASAGQAPLPELKKEIHAPVSHPGATVVSGQPDTGGAENGPVPASSSPSGHGIGDVAAGQSPVSRKADSGVVSSPDGSHSRKGTLPAEEVAGRMPTENTAGYAASPEPPATAGMPVRNDAANNLSAGDGARKATAAVHRTISGTSISSLLNTPKNIHDAVSVEEETVKPQAKVDPESEVKINAAREKFIEKLDRKWPRIAVALSAMNVSGNKLSAVVPTRTLYEEIMRNRSDVLYMLADMARIDGVIELEVEVREGEGPRKPIKAEDKAKFLLERNPLLDMLRKSLDLDLE